MTPTTTVRSELFLQLLVPDRPSLPVAVTLGYCADDPWAVRVTFPTCPQDETSRDAVEWLVARSVLQDGMAACAGDGDLQLWPTAAGNVLRMAMSSPSGEATFELDRDGLDAFLRSTCAVVPYGQESAYVDLDAELGQLLGR